MGYSNPHRDILSIHLPDWCCKPTARAFLIESSLYKYKNKALNVTCTRRGTNWRFGFLFILCKITIYKVCFILELIVCIPLFQHCSVLWEWERRVYRPSVILAAYPVLYIQYIFFLNVPPLPFNLVQETNIFQQLCASYPQISGYPVTGN